MRGKAIASLAFLARIMATTHLGRVQPANRLPAQKSRLDSCRE